MSYAGGMGEFNAMKDNIKHMHEPAGLETDINGNYRNDICVTHPTSPKCNRGGRNRPENGEIDGEQDRLQVPGQEKVPQYNIPQYQLQPVAPPAWLSQYFDSLGR